MCFLNYTMSLVWFGLFAEHHAVTFWNSFLEMWMPTEMSGDHCGVIREFND